MFATKVAPTIAAGCCTMVNKPAEQTPLTLDISPISADSNFGRINKTIARGTCTNEITIRKRYVSAVTTRSGTASVKNTCNNGNWRRMLVNKLEKENGNKESLTLTRC
uniref:Uncharacterized protein n=1 Tax=Tanacetum cinerariifolium TaxID=118510 RepID=A0A699GZ25_TANCI|nr:hypothetical protein [Tanacetum cinerariifolium]